MVKKAETNTDNSWMPSIQASTHLIWLAGLGAFAKVSAEGGKMFETLVREGEKIEQQNRTAVAGQLDVVREKVGEARGKAADVWDRVEQIFEDRLTRVLGQLGVPSRDDLRDLVQRVDALQAHIDALRRIQESQEP